MLEALNILGQVVGLRHALDRPSDPYFCPRCRTRLTLREGVQRQYFAHRRYVRPDCDARTDGEADAEQTITSHDTQAPVEFGATIVNALLSELDLRRVPNQHSLMTSDEVTRAQLCVLFCSRHIWSFRAAQTEQVEIANVMSMLGTADFAHPLRVILASMLANGFNSESFMEIAAILWRRASNINWVKLMGSSGPVKLLFPDWQELSGTVALHYDSEGSRFGHPAIGFFGNITNTSELRLANSGFLGGGFRTGRLTWRDRQPAFSTSNYEPLPTSGLSVAGGETAIVFSSSFYAAQLYITPDPEFVRSFMMEE